MQKYIYTQQQYIIIFTSQYSQICLINSSISEFAHGIFLRGELLDGTH